MTRERIYYILLCTCLLTYITLRAIYVPLVHDEVATYVHYVHQGEFIPGEALVDANNHILNSILCIFSDRLFGTSPLSLRLVNLIGFFVLAFYLFRAASRVDSKLLRWCFILAILGNHYMMEFHGLSRGYGLSMAALFGLLWHLGAYFRAGGGKQLIAIFLWMGVGLGSNLSLLFVAIMAVTLILYRILFHKESRSDLLYVSAMLLMIGLCVVYTFFLKDAGALYYGQGDSFWQVTLETMSLYLTGNDVIAPFIFLAMTVFVLGYFLLNTERTLRSIVEERWIYHVLLFGSLAGIFLTHFLFDSNYPEDRVGLYLYPLLIGAFVYSLDGLKLQVPATRFVGLILLFFPIHFLFQMNLTHADFWFRERMPDSFYTYLSEQVESSEAPPTLDGYNTTSLVYFMGAHLGHFKVPPMVHYDFPSDVADYVIVRGQHGKEYDMSAFDLILTDEPSGNKLWKRKRPKERIEIQQRQEEVGLLDSDEFYEFIRVKVPADSAYAVTFEISYHTDDPPSDVNLILSRSDTAGQSIAYVPHSLGWRQDEERLEDSGALYVDGSGEGTHDLVFYLWNIDKVQIEDLEYSVSLYRLK